MADMDSKQLLISSENAHDLCNDADLPTNSSSESHDLVETTVTVNETVDVIVSQSVDMSTQEDGEACKRSGNDGQLTDSNAADSAKVGSQRRKRTSVQKLLASSDTEAPVKRRRVQHNYRRLSSAGYVDDYDGRERFSGKKTTPAAGSSLSVRKSKTVGSTSRPSTARQRQSKTTRSRSETGTTAVHGQCAFQP